MTLMRLHANSGKQTFIDRVILLRKLGINNDCVSIVELRISCMREDIRHLCRESF